MTEAATEAVMTVEERKKKLWQRYYKRMLITAVLIGFVGWELTPLQPHELLVALTSFIAVIQAFRTIDTLLSYHKL